MKRALFIGLDYYAYVGEIRSALARSGYETDYHPIDHTAFWAKAAKKVSPDAYRRRLDAHHRRLIEASAARRYDLVLFIQCHHVSPENMARLRALHPEARFVLYNWDALTTHDYRPWLPFFDRAFTFDPDDAAATGISYLPLFAIPRFFAVRHDRPKDYDLYFVGSMVTLQRFDALARLHGYCAAAGLRLKMHIRCTPWVRAMLALRGRRLPGLTLRSLDFDEIIDLMERSRGVFDFANHRQSGYTMRFIENMCAGEKTVTDNARVLDEEFYRDDRFLVVRDHDFSAVRDFLDRPVTSALDVRRWSVDNWVRILVEAGQV